MFHPGHPSTSYSSMVGIRNYNPASSFDVTAQNANKDMCGEAGGGMAQPFGNRLGSGLYGPRVFAGAAIGGNINVFLYDGPPDAQISFEIGPGTNPDFSKAVPGRQPFGPILSASTILLVRSFIQCLFLCWWHTYRVHS